MTRAHSMFVTEWTKSHDRIKALQAGGYAIGNRVSAMARFRRLMGREDIKEAINTAEPSYETLNHEEIGSAIKVCWDVINSQTATARDKSAILGTLSKLKGWDKQEKDVKETLPPTFQYMPFTPSEAVEVVPE